jgi:hypothetical protein
MMYNQWGSQQNEVERIGKKPYPWARIDDHSPDCRPSSGAIYIETIGDRVVGVLQVKGLGVLVFSALPPDFTDPSGKVKFEGRLSIFDKMDIGYSPNI